MSQFLSEIQEKYMKIVKSANLIGFLNGLAVSTFLCLFWPKLPISQPLTLNLETLSLTGVWHQNLSECTELA